MPSPDLAAPMSSFSALGRASRRAWLLFAVLALAVIVADQGSKFYAVVHLTEVGYHDSHALAAQIHGFLWQRHPYPVASLSVVPSCFHLRYIENPGAAWGLLSRSGLSFRTPLFLAISLMSMVAVVLYFRRSQPQQRALRVALALVFGGAIGNFADRVRLGYVIDFIDWHIAERYTWPTFNVADAAITVGAILLLIDTVRPPVRVQAPKPSSEL